MKVTLLEVPASRVPRDRRQHAGIAQDPGQGQVPVVDAEIAPGRGIGPDHVEPARRPPGSGRAPPRAPRPAFDPGPVSWRSCRRSSRASSAAGRTSGSGSPATAVPGAAASRPSQSASRSSRCSRQVGERGGGKQARRASLRQAPTARSCPPAPEVRPARQAPAGCRAGSRVRGPAPGDTGGSRKARPGRGRRSRVRCRAASSSGMRSALRARASAAPTVGVAGGISICRRGQRRRAAR